MIAKIFSWKCHKAWNTTIGVWYTEASLAYIWVEAINIIVLAKAVRENEKYGA